MKNKNVYVLTNPLFPKFVKIGTSQDIEGRLKILQASVPSKFTVEYKCEVDNPTKVEKELHNYFDKYRAANGEWFKIKPSIVIKKLKQLKTKCYIRKNRGDVEKLKRKRKPPLNFKKMRIPSGSRNHFKKNMTVREAIIKVLKGNKNGLHYKKITDLIEKEYPQLLSGSKQPSNTVNGRLTTNEHIFEGVGKGVYRLRKG